VIAKSKYKRTLLLLLLIPSLFSPLAGQTEIEENLLEGLSDKEASELLEQLQFLRTHPMDLNHASLDELQGLPFLSPIQARKIILERSKKGPFRSWSNFLHRMKFEKTAWIVWKPYFILSKKSKKDTAVDLRWRHEKQFPDASGYTTDSYLGSPWKSVQKITFASERHLRSGLLIEKDAGETRWNDHVVGFIEGQTSDNQTRCIVGNFRMEAGQGLVLWGPYGLYKGADPIAFVKKRSLGISGYTYADENGFLTGTALETGSKTLRFQIIASWSKLDATLHPDGTVRSLPTSGYHRTESELEKRKCLQETLYGGRITRSWPWGVVGVTAWCNRYSRPIDKKDPERYRFDFQGNQNNVFGLDYDLFWGRVNVSGEIARSRSGGWALVGNSMADLDRISVAVSYRRFDPDFQNPHSHSFGNAPAINEEGFYAGFAAKIAPSSRLSFYYDTYRKPWRSYFIPVPTTGDDLFLQMDHAFSSALTLTFRSQFRRGEKIESSSEETSGQLRERNQHTYRLELQYQPSSRLRLKTRIENVRIFHPKLYGQNDCSCLDEKGTLFYQDIRFHVSRRLTLSARWITFRTDSYDSRIYEFENDLPGIFSILPLYNKGTRWYVLIGWKVFRFLHLAVKFSTTIHHGVTSWGSGYDQIQGDTSQKFGAQADFRF